MRDNTERSDTDPASSLVEAPVERHECSPKNNENLSSREIVYEYIRRQMKEGNLLPGSVLDLKAISRKLGTSSTPLRDSIIRLEAEGYLTIYPRSKVVVNSLELEDFPFLYEIMGSLEYTVIASHMSCYTEEILARMRGYNEKMKIAIEKGDMSAYDTIHYAFHGIFFDVSPNIFAKRILTPIKDRLWDFPRKNFIRDWYIDAINEHELIIRAIENKCPEDLMHAIKELHWGFVYNEKFIKKVYNL